VIELTQEQTKVLKDLLYLNSSNIPNGFVTVGGYAGTGKTTLICELRKQLPKSHSVAFLTFTGKASSVLKKKLENNNALLKSDYVGTIHSFIYKPITKWDRQLKAFVIIGWELKDRYEIFADLIIIDEASMVSESVWYDLQRYNIPIIAVGDHAQLPPVGDNFNLMSKQDFTLTQIHRQALNSPIITLSKFVRNNGYIPEKVFSPEVFKIEWTHPQCQNIWNRVNFKDDDIISLCGFNATRANLNNKIRKRLGHKEEAPYPGEKIVCLKNNHEEKIMNGQIGSVVWLMVLNDDSYRITLDIDGEYYELIVLKKCFGEVTYAMFDRNKKDNPRTTYFDYGYALSVHKSQGDEWNNVILFEQRSQYWDDVYYARWLYTAITRARERLMIIYNSWI